MNRRTAIILIRLRGVLESLGWKFEKQLPEPRVIEQKSNCSYSSEQSAMKSSYKAVNKKRLKRSGKRNK